MVGVDSYMMSGAETDSESTRLRNIQQASDSFTIKHLEATGIGQGWRCLEIGAGGGSIAGWLGDRVCATGSVVATDVDLQRLGDLGAPVEVRRHDIAREGLESAAYDLVHCRLVLQHLTEPVVALQKMATAVAPGGWLVIEEADFGLLEFAARSRVAAGVDRLARRVHPLGSRGRHRLVSGPSTARARRRPRCRGDWRRCFHPDRRTRRPSLRNVSPGLARHPRGSRGGRPHRGRLAIVDAINRLWDAALPSPGTPTPTTSRRSARTSSAITWAR
jgi:SAM-dependent methyltransferase